jgi:hypothetical protein
MEQSSSIASVFSACGSWATLSPDASAFTRDGQMMIYDPVRDRLLIFGGFSGAAVGVTNEVWALSLGATPMLTQFATSGTPPPARGDGSVIYDPVRDRMVVFGGYGASFMNDVWALDLSSTPTWSQIVPAGTPPSERHYHSAVYDATRDRMVVFGGYDYTPNLNDVWVLTFSGTSTWSQMTPSGTPPEPRDSHSAVYDGPRDRMVVFGGSVPNTPDGEGNDAWALSLAGSGSWSKINPGGSSTPPTRYGHTAVVDAPRDRMIVFGGYSNLVPYTLNDVWSLSFTNPIRWTQLTPTGPMPAFAYYFASVYDPVRQRMLSLSADEFWALGGLSGTPSWSMLTPPGQIPRQRWGAAVVYDPPRQRMVMFGGYVYPENERANDLWAYSMSGAGGWTRIVPPGASPSARDQATAVYDPVGDRMILFGGEGNVDLPNDTWQLSLGGSPAWTRLSPTGTPPPGRYAHQAILDTPRNRIVVHGGGDNAITLADTWALSLAGGTSWSQLIPTGGPPPAQEFHTAVFDAPRDRMLTFGWDGNTTWALSLAGPPAWTIVSVSGTPPPGLLAHVAVYDAVRERMLLSMGEPDLNDTYALSLAGTPTWGAVGSVTPLPDGRSLAASLYDTANDRWVVFGGNDYSAVPDYRNDVVALSFPPAYPLSVSASPAAGGTVQQDPADECHPTGAMVTLTAVPAASYLFTGWSGDAGGTTNPLTVTMNAAKNIQAQFVLDVTGVEEPSAGPLPVAFALEEIRPNPGPGPVQVVYSLPRAACVRLGVYDLAGRQVASLVDGERGAGRHSVPWSGAVDGRRARSGIYLVRYESPAGMQVRRLVLLR